MNRPTSPEVVIVSAARTPIGKLNGGLSTLPAHQLGKAAITAALERARVDPAEVSEAILGQVLTAGAGMNPARQAALAAGLAESSTAIGVNQVCGSGLRAVALGWQSLALGTADVVVAGGQESMSQAPHCAQLRPGIKFGNATMTDTMLNDGLTDAIHVYHMGQTAENLAQKWEISREAQDAFAARSQQRAGEAQAAGRFDEEITPVTVPGRKGDTVVSADESIRADTTPEVLAKLRASFGKEGTVTAGNASGISDGAAALVLMRAEEAKRRGLAPLARLASWATSGVDPAIMGYGPVPSTKLALQRAGWKLEEVDLIEANEAFAVQSCVVGQELGWDDERVNVNGGAIALGHPIGASGARVLVTLLHELKRRGGQRGLATLCIGGGMGITLCVERN